MNATNKAAVFAVFTDADNSSASYAERLMALGIASRADAKPFAMEWAAKKYRVAIKQGQRGATLPRDSAAERAMNRVLGICFPAADKPKAKAKSKQQDAVEKLLTAYNKLSKAEQRRFLRSI